jgi:iron(III) transport system substrate-binding protein
MPASFFISSVTAFVLFFLGRGVLQAAQDAEWEHTVAQAKKEGQVVLAAGSDYPEVFQRFQQRYPEIKVVFFPGRGGEMANRIMSERRAGKYLVDLYIVGAQTMYRVLYKAKALDPIKPALMLPEVRDESRWWQRRHLYMDDEQSHIFAFNGVLRTWVGYNTNLVKPAEIKSYWDLLDPQWKGKIIALDSRGPGANAPLSFYFHNPELGPQFIRRLFTEMALTESRDNHQLTDWLGTGRFAFSIFSAINRVGLTTAKQQGLPVDWFDAKSFKEGGALASGSGNVGLLNRAPHPNAARVALNWLLSREGQSIYQKVSDEADSLRIDIPKDDVEPYSRRAEGSKHLVLNAERIDLDPVYKLLDSVQKR